MTKESEKKRTATVAVHLTESERAVMEEFDVWSLGIAVIGRRLVQSLLNDKMTLPDLLQKYSAESSTGNFKTGTQELRNCKVSIRLTRDEKQKLIALAAEGFYLPGELARILLKLFIRGVIGIKELWE